MSWIVIASGTARPASMSCRWLRLRPTLRASFATEMPWTWRRRRMGSSGCARLRALGGVFCFRWVHLLRSRRRRNARRKGATRRWYTIGVGARYSATVAARRHICILVHRKQAADVRQPAFPCATRPIDARAVDECGDVSPAGVICRVSEVTRAYYPLGWAIHCAICAVDATVGSDHGLPGHARSRRSSTI